MPDSLERFCDLFELDPHSLALRPAPELEAGTVLPGAAIMRIPQEIERFGLAFAPALSAFGGICAELNQAGFLRVQAQCKFGQAVLEIAQKALRLTPVLEAHNGVVGVSHDDHVAGRTPFAPLLHPEIVDVVKVHVPAAVMPLPPA